jgi:hypothetical protein
MMNDMIGISTRYYSTLHDNQATEQREALIQQMLQLLDKAAAPHTPAPASDTSSLMLKTCVKPSKPATSN